MNGFGEKSWYESDIETALVRPRVVHHVLENQRFVQFRVLARVQSDPIFKQRSHLLKNKHTHTQNDDTSPRITIPIVDKVRALTF